MKANKTTTSKSVSEAYFQVGPKAWLPCLIKNLGLAANTNQTPQCCPQVMSWPDPDPQPPSPPFPPSPPWAPFSPWAPYAPYTYTSRAWVQLPQRSLLAWQGAVLMAASAGAVLAYYLYCSFKRYIKAR
jgi:hypothetical protein